MAEEEEALRIVLEITQAMMPAAREIVLLGARALTKAGGVAVHAAGRAANEAVSMVDGLGTKGVISTRKLRSHGDQISVVDCADAYNREDIKQLAEECRKMGLGFSVTERPETGNLCILFKAKDAEMMSLCMGSLMDKYHVTDEEVAEAATPCPARREGQVAQEFEREGSTWTPLGNSRPGCQVFRADLGEVAGRQAKALVSEKGAWSVRDASGAVMSGPNGKRLQGTVSSGELFGAIHAAVSCAATLRDQALVRADQEAGYNTPEREAAREATPERVAKAATKGREGPARKQKRTRAAQKRQKLAKGR